MRDTVYTFSESANEQQITDAITQVIEAVQAYVPGYRLKQDIQFDYLEDVNIPGIGRLSGLKTSVFLEVEGAAHYLPAYAGNLDIMTSAALYTAEQIAVQYAATTPIENE